VVDTPWRPPMQRWACISHPSPPSAAGHPRQGRQHWHQQEAGHRAGPAAGQL
jgi:hypothetical protein